MKKVVTLLGVALLGLFGCSNPETAKQTSPKTLEKVDFILDWTPNTNHTGLYVAKEKGFLASEGIDLDIKLPPEDSSSDLVVNNKAPFAVYFQDSMAKKLAKGAPISAVAAIVEHNTSGIISKKETGITSPKQLEGKTYGTWNDPIELAMLSHIVTQQGGRYDDVKLVPNVDSNSMVPIVNGLFDSAWVFHAWDGIMAKEELKLDTNFFYLKDYAPQLDYYTPVIIANNEYLKNNPEQAKKVLRAIKKGYQYAIEHPEESADILIKYAPELKERRDFIVKSQQYISKQYASDPKRWGEIDAKRWNDFYQFLADAKILDNKLPENAGFTNEYLK
ncbi:ABC transporter substrate-binding protein [Carnobacteriaceae bacterium zg-ZUI252]|nr:ABC transporter substrate-binding protein [Carnobacteriaceae bacterium zg-ZUI252]